MNNSVSGWFHDSLILIKIEMDGKSCKKLTHDRIGKFPPTQDSQVTLQAYPTIQFHKYDFHCLGNGGEAI